VRCDVACLPAFARHETFHPRYGWVKKAVDAAAASTSAFTAEDAVVNLGVGKNMVRAIRYWGLAYRVLIQTKADGSRLPLVAPSDIGKIVFGVEGWDPYAEFADTHWLLHWWLLAPGSLAPAWWLAFNEFPAVQFTDTQLEEFIIDRVGEWADPHPSSVKKDVSCLLRMYAADDTSRSGFDDQIDCPSRDLGLIQAGAERGTYRFVIGHKPSLTPAVAAFACLDFIARTDPAARTVTLSRLSTEPGAPGKAFKLSESALTDLLAAASQQYNVLELTSHAGVAQIAFDDNAAVTATELLFDHYSSLSGAAHFPAAGMLLSPHELSQGAA
jgi:hypothetical protein